MLDLFGARRLHQIIEQLENRLLKLETQHKLIEQEWNGVYDKYRVAMQKLARRDERAKPDEEAPRSNGTKVNPELDRWRVR